MSALLLTLTPFLPLALALAMVPRRSRAAVSLLLPAAPLPGLASALLAEPGASLLLPPVLLGLDLGLSLELGEGRRLLLAMTALLWIAAAVYGRGYLPLDRRRTRYDAFFLVTMGGSLGLIVALDVPGFYLFFSLMTLSSYILVVFEGDGRAYRAGRAYIVLSILGETALLLGFLRAVAAADSLMIAAIPPALAQGETATLLLLFGGFAIKAGQLPLHLWLPLAHSAAPTPASAVLSGAMIKAGLLGMLLFLPLGEASLPGFGRAVAGLGLATAFYGVLCGLSQTNPKTVLAYSSLSQMGLLVAGIGVTLAAPEAAPALLPALLLYALHHGLTKAGLFFSVGLLQQGRRGRRPALALAALGALAVAGAPLTAGALAKLLLKQGVEAGAAAATATLLSWSAVATALLMLRFLLLLRAVAPKGDAAAGPLLWGPFAAVMLLGQALPWGLVLTGPAGAEALSAYGLWQSLWPPLLAATLALAWRFLRRRGLPAAPAVPEGDWIALLPSLRDAGAGWSRLYRRLARPLRRRPQLPDGVTDRLAAGLARLESQLLRQPQGAAALLLLAGGLALALLA